MMMMISFFLSFLDFCDGYFTFIADRTSARVEVSRKNAQLSHFYVFLLTFWETFNLVVFFSSGPRELL